MECWTFGDFVLDLGSHELVRAGTPVSLSPKAFQLLGFDVMIDTDFNLKLIEEFAEGVHDRHERAAGSPR